MRKNIYDSEIVMLKESELISASMDNNYLATNRLIIINKYKKMLSEYSKSNNYNLEYAINPFKDYSMMVLYNLINEYESSNAKNTYIYSNHLINAYLFATVFDGKEEISIKKYLENIIRIEAGKCQFSIKYLKNKYGSLAIDYILSRKNYDFNNELLLENDANIRYLSNDVIEPKKIEQSNILKLKRII